MFRKKRTAPNVSPCQWTENQYEDYLSNLYGMKCIIGFTENGMPYGIFDDEINNEFGDDFAVQSDKDLPFLF